MPRRLVKRIDTEGYVVVPIGRGHPLADSRGLVREHVLVWVAAGRRPPRAHELIHHRNDNRQDNRLSNLRLCTRAWHSAYHAKRQPRYRNGKFRRAA